MKRELLLGVCALLLGTAASTALAARPDTTAPTTTASPVGGIFTSSVTVTLAANEPATTYYCTGGGCNPTTLYSAALSFSATTTLRYYSRDTAGNTETTKQQVYTIQPQACTTEPIVAGHEDLTWSGSYTLCQQCHSSQVDDVLHSTHYQWKGPALEMSTGGGTQGKDVQRDAQGNIIPGTSAINAYCVNVLGNFPGACGSCHTGLGAAPTATNKENIDCLLCHQKNYKRVKVAGTYQPDTANMCIDMNTAVKTLHKPKRENCLQCHAKAGGGDAVKRGDLAMASGNTTDTHYDNHMATAGANLDCQDCHTFSNHKVAGRGSDLRPSDSTVILACTNCHTDKASSTGHTTTDVNKHVDKVACQTCHIPRYAKNASDTAATEATETHRTWEHAEWNTALLRYEPTPTKQNDLKPKYKHWNGTSWGNNLMDDAVFDSATGAYKVSRPLGSINDLNSKLFPFKYKTADQPYAPAANKLIAISTSTYFATGNYDQAVKNGLMNMGYADTTPYTTVKADEYQVLNHQVPPASEALQCNACHPNASATQVKLVTELGYGLKAGKNKTQICSQCHADKKMPTFERLHNNHVHTARNRDCSWCHDFSRAEEGYCAPPGPCS